MKKGLAPAGAAKLKLRARSGRLVLLLSTTCASMLTPFASARADETSVDSISDMSIEQLMNVEVTSVSKRPEKLLVAPAAVQVITGEDIRRSGAADLPTALQLAGNLDIAQKNAHEWIISSRGFSQDVANKLLVLVDGRTVYTPLFSGVFWDRQDYLLADINRIETVNGPGGTLWGANAVNGVINITTKSAKDTQGIYAEAGGGTNPRSLVSARYGGAVSSNTFYRVYAKYTNHDNGVLPNGAPAPDAWNSMQGGFRVDAESSAADNITVQGDIYKNNEGLVAGGGAKTAGGNVLGRWSRMMSDTSDMSLQLYYDRTHFRTAEPAFLISPAGFLTDDLDTVDVDFQYRFLLGDRHRFVLGAGYRFTHDVVGNAPSLAFLPPTLDQSLANAFVQDEISLSDSVVLTIGTKVEHNDYTGFEVEPNARVQWRINDQQTLWGAVSRAVRTPSRIDRDLSQPGPSSPIIVLKGGAAFKSETLLAYETGYRAQITTGMGAAVSLFYNDYGNVRSATASAPDPVFHLPFPVFFENNLEGHTYGFELSADARMTDWWRLKANYRLLKEDIHVKPGKTDINNALNETFDPKSQFSLHTSFDVLKNLELDGGLRWIGRRKINNSGVAVFVGSYAELDTRLGWRITDSVELSVVGQNLLHHSHPEYGKPDATQVGIERSVYAKVAWRM